MLQTEIYNYIVTDEGGVASRTFMDGFLSNKIFDIRDRLISETLR